MNEIEILDHFRHMAALSAKMCQAAQQADWDSLVEQERLLVQARRTRILSAPEMAGLSEAGQKHVRALIEKMLEDDAEVRRHVTPWLGSTRRYLASLNQGQKMQNAYRALGG
jgi:flagellar protein FliT